MRLWPSVLFLIGNPCFPSWLCCWLVTVSCPTLRDPMDYRPPGSPVHGISQGGILERVAISPPVDLPDPGVQSTSPVSPALAGRFFTTEPPGRPSLGSGRTQVKNPTIYPRGCHQYCPVWCPTPMMASEFEAAWRRERRQRILGSPLCSFPVPLEHRGLLASSPQIIVFTRGEFWATERKCPGSHWRSETNPSALGWWFWANPSWDPSQGTSSGHWPGTVQAYRLWMGSWSGGGQNSRKNPGIPSAPPLSLS